MKKNITILILGVVLSFCFIILYKGLNNPNTYVPKTSIKNGNIFFNASFGYISIWIIQSFV